MQWTKKSTLVSWLQQFSIEEPGFFWFFYVLISFEQNQVLASVQKMHLLFNFSLQKFLEVLCLW